MKNAGWNDWASGTGIDARPAVRHAKHLGCLQGNLWVLRMALLVWGVDFCSMAIPEDSLLSLQDSR